MILPSRKGDGQPHEDVAKLPALALETRRWRTRESTVAAESLPLTRLRLLPARRRCLVDGQLGAWYLYAEVKGFTRMTRFPTGHNNLPRVSGWS